MNISAIAFDLDGTLLRSDSTISSNTIQTLQRCKQKGLRIIAATGRPRRMNNVLDAVRSLLDAEIYNNGAEGWHGEKQVFSHTISGERASKIMRLITEQFPKLPLAAETVQGVYSNFDATLWWGEVNYTLTDWSKPIPDALKLTALPRGLGISRETRVAFERPYCLEEIAKTFPSDLPVLNIEDGWIIQAIPQNTDKASGVEWMLAEWGLRPEDCVAFGDDGNDLEMLMAVGYGVAMGNAFERVRQSAKHETADNDNDGVAAWLERYVLAEK